MHLRLRMFALAAAIALIVFTPLTGVAAERSQTSINEVVSTAIRPLMQRYGIPGMAVALVIDGKPYVFNYGVASKATGKPVTRATIFEIGSISKTFTATLAAYAHVRGRLALDAHASTILPELRGSAFDHIRLMQLGTHTAGGLPLQMPDGIATDAQAMAYFRHWKPSYAPGTYRVYSNPTIGLLGLAAARSMHGDFETLERAKILAGIGMRATYLDVPASKMADYAQGYRETGEPIRLTPGALGVETYGIRTTADDMARYLRANMQLISDLDPSLKRAIAQTHTAYYRVGTLAQDLVWEQYPAPVTLADLLAGNSEQMIFEPNRTTAIVPPQAPRSDVFINKTGSTNGFAAYIAFIPARKLGIVVLANKNYPIDARVRTAHAVLTRFGE